MMKFWYTVGVHFYFLLIKSFSLLGHKKAIKFINGRKDVFSFLKNEIKKYNSNKRIWIHVSSLGEFEQAKPLLIELKKNYPDCLILLSFFSPSGMDYAKTNDLSIIKFYLPKDTSKNANTILDIIRPNLILWVKYDFWHYYISESKQRKIPILLISAHFRENQIYSKSWAHFYRSILNNFTRIYTQNTASSDLLNKWGINNHLTNGDTRIDSVISSKTEAITIPKLDHFIQKNKQAFIIGSAWEDDIDFIASIFKNIVSKYQLIIAPHDIQDGMIQKIESAFSEFSIQKYTDSSDVQNSDILIINTIGILKHCYRYATASWIGGGFRRSGIHNILEPAVYGNAVFFGPNYSKFPEATDLLKLGGAICAKEKNTIETLLLDKMKIKEMGTICQNYILEHAGATQKIIKDIQAFI